MYISELRLGCLGLLVIAVTACSSGGSDGGGGGGTPTPEAYNFVAFETGQVRPLAMSPDGNSLYAVNTPNSTLEIYSITDTGLQHSATVPVGMEPVAVAALNSLQIWVVNHLSDSVSVIDVSVSPPRVTRTLLVGDEPRDIVFAGAGKQYAFITTAHRGQNGPDDNPIDAHLTTSVGRADVWVFNTANPGGTLGGDPLTVINLFGDTPRALTVSPDGNTVYAAVFLSGNQTTAIGENRLAKPAPLANVLGDPQPDTGLILKYNGVNWADGNGSITDATDQLWDNYVNLSLPDYDVFEIDASVNPPVARTSAQYSGVGTVLYNMVTNPQTGVIYVSNTEALNHVRFEGPGNNASTVRGHFAESRITVIDNTQAAPQILPRHLNKHINYTQFPGAQSERAAALANPLDMAVTSDGNTLYAAAFGSQKIGVFNTAALEDDSFISDAANQISLSAGGPSGVVLDETRDRLYALTRFDNGLSVIDTTSSQEVSHLTMFNPEPAHVINGRRFLYDATLTSSRGDSSCALCHVFGDFDGLAWDLGNPDEEVVANPNPFATVTVGPITVPLLPPDPPVFHPMKGPMSTQSLRGLDGNGPMHWRGDRVGASAQPGESIELGAFKDFNVAFPGLLGRASELAATDIHAYAEFALEITYPPNPIRALDNSLTTTQSQGRNIYMNQLTTGMNGLTDLPILKCNDCHVLNELEGHFGTSGLSSVEGPDISQQFKIPHLRNMYQKVGKFGVSGKFAPDVLPMGDQIRGFGFMHDGAMDTLDNFLSGSVFIFDSDPATNDQKRSQVVDFVMAMDSELAPIVGQQITLSAASGADVHARIDLLRARAQLTAPRPECDLIVKGVIDGVPRGAFMQASGNYQMDRANEVISDANLRALVNQNAQTLTFTCVPPGSGMWMGLDRDRDGIFDSDEAD
ncbi:MAG: hypothetical protein L0Z73_15555 [Gammaproteobacteria bacterium]|nr:hypothetical protein [Gammaproteobacteria bacterium]